MTRTKATSVTMVEVEEEFKNKVGRWQTGRLTEEEEGEANVRLLERMRWSSPLVRTGSRPELAMIAVGRLTEGPESRLRIL